MSKWRWLWGAAVLGAALLTGARASAGAAAGAGAGAGDTLRVTLEACVDRALSLSEEVRSAEADRSTAHARYLQARATALPQLSFNTTYTRQLQSIFQNTGSGVEPFEADTTQPVEQRLRDVERALPTSGFYALSALLSSSSFASENSWNAALSLQQKIFQGGNIVGSIAAAGHALRAADLMRQDKREEITLSVRKAYLDALLADRGLAIARLGREQSEIQLQRVKLRADAGTASEFELLQAEVGRDNQIPAIKAAETARELAYLELRRLCNLPEDVPVRLSSRLLDPEALPTGPAPVDTVGLNDAAMRTSGVTALDQMLQARRHAVTVAVSDLYPDFSAFANLSQQAYPSGTWPKRGNWLRSLSVGVTVNWTLFDGFRTKGAIEEARSNVTRAGDDLAQARELVQMAVRQGVGDMARSAADLDSRLGTVKLAGRALDLANLRFSEGASSMLEVADARVNWQIAQSYEAAARRDYFAALARLERYTGRPLFPQGAGEGAGK
jgi:outer membrane protein TolC